MATTPRTKPCVTLITGPMYAGKSTELQRSLRRYLNGPAVHVVCLTYGKDTRYQQTATFTPDAHSSAPAHGESQSVTHDKMAFPAYPVETLQEAQDLIADAAVIGIDEGQFFEDLAVWVPKWANAGRHVYVAALNATFEQKSFSSVAALLGNVDEIIYEKAVCVVCGADGSHSHRLESTNSGEVIQIGGAETYVALCRLCLISKSPAEIEAMVKK